MPAYNFQKRFVADVRSGKKRQTMRAARKDKRVPKVGDPCYLYTKMRSADCELIRVEACINTNPSWIDCEERELHVANQQLRGNELTAFAAAECFDSVDDMFDFFERHHGNDFTGHVIYW